MNPLDLLKTQLQNALNESTESVDYKDALEDGVYSCGLGITALEEWVSIWINPLYCNFSVKEAEYQKGVKFVEDKWHQITGMF